MPITATTPSDIAGGTDIYGLETLVNALRGNQIESATSGDGIITFNLVGGSTVILQIGKIKAGILTGCEVTRTSALNYDVDAGSYQGYGRVFTHAALVSLSVGSPHATLDRFDLIIGDDAGTLSVVAGTASATPAYPSVAANETILHVVGIPPATSSFVDSVIVSMQVDTPTIPAIEVNANGQVIIGGGVVKPTVVTYTGAGAVDITASHHLVDSSGGTFAITLPLEANADEIEGITYSFFDSGSATANNWTVRNMAGVVLETATTNNQVIRVTFMGTTYKIG